MKESASSSWPLASECASHQKCQEAQMKLLNRAGVDGATVDLSPLETRGLRGGLGEICFGFEVADFNARIGATRDEARTLFEKLDRLSLDGQNVILLTREEIRLLKNAHEQTLNELGVEEYGTRTGVNFADGQVIMKGLLKLATALARS